MLEWSDAVGEANHCTMRVADEIGGLVPQQNGAHRARFEGMPDSLPEISGAVIQIQALSR